MAPKSPHRESYTGNAREIERGNDRPDANRPDLPGHPNLSSSSSDRARSRLTSIAIGNALYISTWLYNPTTHPHNSIAPNFPSRPR
ncbi:hypothetical protein FQN51_008561 [Onygenales sp. PD_10]|nr:hypothetical protein FQN51_008561 [Onygenales sp. PD_10]